MILRIRKQYPEFEINEFSEERAITVDNAIAEFKDFNWDSENAKSLKIIEQHADPSIRLAKRKRQLLDNIRALDGN